LTLDPRCLPHHTSQLLTAETAISLHQALQTLQLFPIRFNAFFVPYSFYVSWPRARGAFWRRFHSKSLFPRLLSAGLGKRSRYQIPLTISFFLPFFHACPLPSRLAIPQTISSATAFFLSPLPHYILPGIGLSLYSFPFQAYHPPFPTGVVVTPSFKSTVLIMKCPFSSFIHPSPHHLSRVDIAEGAQPSLPRKFHSIYYGGSSDNTSGEFFSSSLNEYSYIAFFYAYGKEAG